MVTGVPEVAKDCCKMWVNAENWAVFLYSVGLISMTTKVTDKVKKFAPESSLSTHTLSITPLFVMFFISYFVVNPSDFGLAGKVSFKTILMNFTNG